VSLETINGIVRQRQMTHLRKQLRQTRAEMRRRVGDRDRQIAELSQKISELNRRIVEFDQRFDEITAEVTRVRAVEDLHVKQKSVCASDVPSTSSATCEISLPKQSSMLSVPETSVSDPSHSISDTETNSVKRKHVADEIQIPRSKRRKKTDSSAVDTDIRCLRSGRQVFFK